MSPMIETTVQTEERAQALEMTSQLNEVIDGLGPTEGGIHVWVPHTTAGVIVNESADPNVMDDLIRKLDELVPWNDNYEHIEDNAAAHVKSILLGSEQWVPVSEGELNLGRWQGVFLLEWDGPRTRTVQVYS